MLTCGRDSADRSGCAFSLEGYNLPGLPGRRRQGKSAEVLARFGQVSNAQKRSELWNRLSDLRNGLTHCGMRKDARDEIYKVFKSRITNIQRNLWVLLEDAPDRVLYGRRLAVDLKKLYGEVAKLDEPPLYLQRAKELAGEGNEVVLTGRAHPSGFIWPWPMPSTARSVECFTLRQPGARC